MKTKPTKGAPAPEIETPAVHPDVAAGHAAFEAVQQLSATRDHIDRVARAGAIEAMFGPLRRQWAGWLPECEAYAQETTAMLAEAEALGILESVIGEARITMKIANVKEAFAKLDTLAQRPPQPNDEAEILAAREALKWGGLVSPVEAARKARAKLAEVMQERARAAALRAGMPLPSVRPDPAPAKGAEPVAITDFNPMEGPSWPIR
jgi:hypothetical protein